MRHFFNPFISKIDPKIARIPYKYLMKNKYMSNLNSIGGMRFVHNAQ